MIRYFYKYVSMLEEGFEKAFLEEVNIETKGTEICLRPVNK